MSKKLELGDRVCKLDEGLDKHNPDEDTLQRGVIEGLSRKENKVFVKWDQSWVRPNPEEVDLLAIIPEAEAEARASSLEAEYEVWASKVRAKCQAAAALISEASDLAEEHGHTLGEEYDLNSGIKGAMGNAGWRTSSWNC